MSPRASTVKSPTPPPICIYYNDTTALTKIIKDAVKHKFTMKVGLDYFTLKTSEINDHNAVICVLKDKDIEHFTYNVKGERPIKYLIKYIPVDVDLKLLESELRDREIPFSSITFLTKIVTNNNKREKQKIPLVLINAPRDSAVKLQALNSLMHLAVKIEPYTSNAIGQCYRCQDFGHSSLNCNRKPKCIRCSAAHLTKVCQIKNSETPPKCVNCLQLHTANYKGCLAYKLAIKEREKYSRGQNPNVGESNNTRNPPPRDNQRYFPALPPTTNAWTQRQLSDINTDINTNNRPTTDRTRPIENKEASLKDLIQEVRNLFQSFNLRKTLDTIRTAVAKLRTATSPLDKFIVVSETLEQLFDI